MKFFMNNKRVIISVLMVIAILAAVSVPAFAASSESGAEKLVDDVVDLINKILGWVLTIVGAVGALYCVFLGIKFAKAEEPQDREKAKSHLKNAIIGFVLIFVLMLALKLVMPDLINWVQTNGADS